MILVIIIIYCYHCAGGRYDEGIVFSEKEWASEEASSPYGKSKLQAEKTAWELVENLPGKEVCNLMLLQWHNNYVITSCNGLPLQLSLPSGSFFHISEVSAQQQQY